MCYSEGAAIHREAQGKVGPDLGLAADMARERVTLVRDGKVLRTPRTCECTEGFQKKKQRHGERRAMTW